MKKHVVKCSIFDIIVFSKVFMVDQKEGTAQLRTREPLNCEEQRNFTVNIAAVSCNGKVSNR